MKNLLTRIVSDKQQKETLWGFVAKGFFLMSGIVLLILLPNKMGVRSYGVFALLFAYAELFKIFFGSIFIVGVKKEITEGKFSNDSKKYLIHSVISTVALFSISSIIFIVLTRNTDISLTLSQYYKHFIIIQGAIVFWSCVLHVFEYTHRLFFVALMYFLEYTSKLFLLLILVIQNLTSIENVIMIFALGYLLSATVGSIIIYSKYRPWSFKEFLDIDKGILNKIFGRSLALGLSSLSVVILSKIDMIMISKYLTLQDVGYYSIASEIAKNASIISVPIILGVVPIFVKETNRRHRYSVTVRKLVIINAMVAFSMIVFGKTALKFLYGFEIEYSLNVLYILSFLPMFISLQTLTQNLLILADLTKVVLKYSLFFALLNIILNAILIRLYGISGSAISTVFVYFSWYLASSRNLRASNYIT